MSTTTRAGEDTVMPSWTTVDVGRRSEMTLTSDDVRDRGRLLRSVNTT
ncbi:hypothetical protein [Gordonia sp. NPDC003422]